MPDTRKLIAGALRNCIDAHGPITLQYVDSAAKRIEGQLAGVDFDSYWRRRYDQLRAARDKKATVGVFVDIEGDLVVFE